MGETICRNCGEMNGHLYCHATGKCEYCGSPVTWCDSCNMPIPSFVGEHEVFTAIREKIGGKK